MEKDIFKINAGVKLCSSCENNIRCIECFYKKRYDELVEKHDILIEKNQCLVEEVSKAKAKAADEFSYRLKIKIGFSNLMKREWLQKIINEVRDEMVGARK